jgi:hypothetical protein
MLCRHTIELPKNLSEVRAGLIPAKNSPTGSKPTNS